MVVFHRNSAAVAAVDDDNALILVWDSTKYQLIPIRICICPTCLDLE